MTRQVKIKTIEFDSDQNETTEDTIFSIDPDEYERWKGTVVSIGEPASFADIEDALKELAERGLIPD